VDRAFPAKEVEHLSPRHPMLNPGQPGMDDLAKARLRPGSRKGKGPESSGLDFIEAGKGHIILSRHDVTSGLLGTRTWGISGFDPVYAQSLLKNAIFWTLDGQPGAE
jgi:hypothetical protein